MWCTQAKVSSQSLCCSALGGILHRCPLSPLGFQTLSPSFFFPPSLSIHLQAASPPPSHLYLLIFSLCSPCSDDLVQSQAVGIHTDSCSPQGTSPDKSPELRSSVLPNISLFAHLIRISSIMFQPNFWSSPTLTCFSLQSFSSQWKTLPPTVPGCSSPQS